MDVDAVSPAVVFAELARDFCAWCEGAALGPGSETAAAIWLSKLHAAALSLPQVEPENEDGLPALSSEETARARGNLAYFNGWYYREVFDPTPTLSDEPVMGDVGDDLLDTYKDIKSGSVLFERGELTEALWHWSFLHQVHWGRHAVGAVLALHCLSESTDE
jgi:hypothetical protein